MVARLVFLALFLLSGYAAYRLTYMPFNDAHALLGSGIAAVIVTVTLVLSTSTFLGFFVSTFFPVERSPDGVLRYDDRRPLWRLLHAVGLIRTDYTITICGLRWAGAFFSLMGVGASCALFLIYNLPGYILSGKLTLLQVLVLVMILSCVPLTALLINSKRAVLRVVAEITLALVILILMGLIGYVTYVDPLLAPDWESLIWSIQMIVVAAGVYSFVVWVAAWALMDTTLGTIARSTYEKVCVNIEPKKPLSS